MCLSCVSFVFCNQKTAYEMRISYWNSDVCSSDLACRVYHCCTLTLASWFRLPCWKTWLHLQIPPPHHRRNADPRASRCARHWLALRCTTSRNVARMGGVWGKGVSVRVALGGRRIVKKKKNIYAD